MKQLIINYPLMYVINLLFLPNVLLFQAIYLIAPLMFKFLFSFFQVYYSNHYLNYLNILNFLNKLKFILLTWQFLHFIILKYY